MKYDPLFVAIARQVIYVAATVAAATAFACVAFGSVRISEEVDCVPDPRNRYSTSPHPLQRLSVIVVDQPAHLSQAGAHFEKFGGSVPVRYGGVG